MNWESTIRRFWKRRSSRATSAVKAQHSRARRAFRLLHAEWLLISTLKLLPPQRTFRNLRRRQSGSYFRPIRAEHLERRLAPATVVVTTNSDALNGNVTSIASLINEPGADGISLREAIIAANHTASGTP